MSQVQIKNQNFKSGDVITEKPDFWNESFIKIQLKPVFTWEEGKLIISGNGNPYIFGCWTQKVAVQEGKTYRFSVRFQVEDIDDVNLQVMNLICWLKTENPSDQCPHDNISTYRREGQHIVGEDVFSVPPGVNQAEIQLGLRFTERGRVIWNHVELIQTERAAPRPATITVVKWRPYLDGTAVENLAKIRELLDKAGAMESDLVLLPEYSSVHRKGVEYKMFAEKIPDGAVCEVLREKAIAHQMHVCAGIIENDDDLLFSTAVIFDRKGELAGKYRKTHLFWPEEMFQGLSPGHEYPVFNLDFGKVGVVICYDNWYGEIHKLLALKGAELILVPNEAYEPLLMHTRALDNRVYIAAASIEMKAMLVNTKGRIIAETTDGLVTGRIDLNDRRLAYPYPGGTLNHSSGGRRSARNSMDDGLYEMLAEEMKTWENRPESFHWYQERQGPVLEP
ncbi:carbon-nitrogen hydrolase family protein [candidate division KSB1 bacterium]|nr:carbon-nitrogen hydrolase family protein [candidate division KSB1 bacterium]